MDFLTALKTVAFSSLGSALIGLFAGFVYSIFHKAHPHQIIPDWLLFAILALIVGFVVAVLCILINLFCNCLKINMVLLIAYTASFFVLAWSMLR